MAHRKYDQALKDQAIEAVVRHYTPVLPFANDGDMTKHQTNQPPKTTKKFIQLSRIF